MIELTNLTAQTILPGGSVTFDRVVLHSGCGECFNSMIPTSVKLRTNGIYDVEFHGNITANAATTAIQLQMAIADSPIATTVMNATPAAAGDLVNVSAGTFVRDCCCDADRISIRNTGTAPLVLAAGSSFRIARRS